MVPLAGPTILVVAREVSTLDFLQKSLFRHYQVHCAGSIEEMSDNICGWKYDAILLDVRLPRMDLQETVRDLIQLDSGPAVIVIASSSDIHAAVFAMRAGARDCIIEPIDAKNALACVGQALWDCFLSGERIAPIPERSFAGMIAASPAMEVALSRVDGVRNSNASVLITGESGTGKELTARAIHRWGHRANGPFVAFNCACSPDSLIDNELFGHDKGAFTGAVADHVGYFEKADGGTLFLDEISLMSRDGQAKLLRVLDEGKIQRLGGTQLTNIDVRIIAATNLDLSESVEKGEFREDLYYRINGVSIHLPPLRRRKEDILPLVRHFLSRHFIETGKKYENVSPRAVAYILGYKWKGNIRQLKNVIEQCALLEKGTVITDAFLPSDMTRNSENPPADDDSKFSLKTTREEAEKHVILQGLGSCDWNISEAARTLEIHRNSLRRKMVKYGITNPV